MSTAVVTMQMAIAMQSKAYRTVFACKNMGAVFALYKKTVATAIEKDERLFFTLKTLAYCSSQFVADPKITFSFGCIS